MLKEKEENGLLHIHHHQSHDSYKHREIGILESGILDGDMFLQVREQNFNFDSKIMNWKKYA